jgi:hypothetical protein
MNAVVMTNSNVEIDFIESSLIAFKVLSAGVVDCFSFNLGNCVTLEYPNPS